MEEQIQMEPEARICNKCKVLKWDDEFGIDNSKEDKLRSICKVCLSLYWKEYYVKNRSAEISRSTNYYNSNPDKKSLRIKRYYLSHQNDILKYNKKYYKENKDLIIQRSTEYNKLHPEQRKEISGKWKRFNRAKATSLAVKYKLAKIQRLPKWADLKVIDQFYINCPPGMVVDHIVPLQGKNVSGFHVEYNLQYLTPSENSSKGNKFGGNI